ncbi:succinyldiaminopimelate aminotransferase [Sinobacterium caligoides]|uniref:Succinyldiaminopimelate aminotransferase n=1 Tax=Sinobacterium caligoides TaxID=933926 RepID=A0A3N2DMN7_9GAMM|nr:succinyldiaminopimelate transaminase [Sinobacterium caligoides]ROS01050.1 succinyldiaminopimelate aminotransferase [Sinobacterium caligoides]
MNNHLTQLHPYPFEKLNALKSAVTANESLEHIPLSIGEPKHRPPAFVLDNLANNLDKVSGYPSTAGILPLRQAIATWASQRFELKANSLTAERHVLPVNGTREALFAFTQAVIQRSDDAIVMMPNPFYQIYEGATLLAGATPYYLNCLEENHYQPDYDAIPEAIWQRTQLLFICSPGNPTGAVADMATLKKLIALADRYDFIIASDECYSELYFDETQPPAGLLGACAELGRDDFRRCTVFHSLSKRSNLPGLRSGFVAGDEGIIKPFLQYRTYHGCAMPLHHQHASICAWNDEQHVQHNRALYREKFTAVLAILGDLLDVEHPDAGFYLWAKVGSHEGSDTDFAQRLFAEQNITVLPGSMLARESHGCNPGCGRIRMALVAELEQCIEAAERIKTFLGAPR